MAKITYSRADGTSDTVDVPAGSTVMRGAVLNGVRGVVGECGGAGQCGTCHVFVDASDADRVTPLHPLESEVLDTTAVPRRPTSRLGCQIPVGEELDSLEVKLPDYQLPPV
ncbi:(2Fe-2S)-binding protein [Actinospica acidiphila]|uniref:(2Fe-2S)-binding protein n=1 Tax=Actinospica acidiphila TaxID=304899 RepID=A0A9X5CS85_9ACTN|nr:2Fe-2S iron-sulfur cluster-binding protein [Actinospica acidiphila]NEC53769.1 (2Fe-2S)-binding protein [Actinospica acidiphila]